MTIYRETLQDLKTACSKYRRHLLGIEELKAAVWEAAQTIVAVEELELHKFLQWAEGQLDMVQFTVDQENIFRESLKIVSQIEEQIQQWEQDVPLLD
jgi:hypothetical protein